MTLNWWTFLLQALNFVVLAYVLHRLLYKPLRQAVEQRREATERARTEAEKARKDAEALQQQLEEQLAQAQRQRQEAVHQARAWKGKMAWARGSRIGCGMCVPVWCVN
jgi:F-type H+-transporting ATPase subunit b